MHHSNRKSPDKVALDPSLFLRLKVTHLMSIMLLNLFLNVFIKVQKHVLCFFYSKIYVLHMFSYCLFLFCLPTAIPFAFDIAIQ